MAAIVLPPGGAPPMRAAKDRLGRAEFFIVLVLADGPLHGSEIARQVLETSEGRVRLWPVRLYRTLDELSAAGLIEVLSPERHPEGESRRRKYYGITAEGSAWLRAEAHHLAGLAAVALDAVRADHARNG